MCSKQAEPGLCIAAGAHLLHLAGAADAANHAGVPGLREAARVRPPLEALLGNPLVPAGRKLVWRT